jgi:hypothetical protein
MLQSSVHIRYADVCEEEWYSTLHPLITEMETEETQAETKCLVLQCNKTGVWYSIPEQ